MQMRRTFVILPLRAGMDVLHLQTMPGHESLEMTRHDADMVDEDLLREHKAHSPIDNLSKLESQAMFRSQPLIWFINRPKWLMSIFCNHTDRTAR